MKNQELKDEKNIVKHSNEQKNQLQKIIKLDESSINKIAAGEVVERPAAVVKELIENALDASALSIQIFFSQGGKSLIKVIDDGWGIRKDELKLAIASHSTSKVHHNNLSQIDTFGFRGEALPSIAAVSRLTIKSRAREESEATELVCSAGRVEKMRPVALSFGTIVEIRELFYSTPARLKFLRTDRAETQAIYDVVKRLALSNPNIKFQLQDVSKNQNKVVFDLSKELSKDKFFKRIEKVLGKGFSENCVELNYQKDGYVVSGFTSLPTNSIGTSINQFFFVNGRSVKDKQLAGALRAAYFDFVSKDRFAAAVVYLSCEPSLVDVNVHPMKSEVRFKFPKEVRSLIIHAVKETLSQNGLKSNSALSVKTIGSFLSNQPISADKINIANSDSSSVYEEGSNLEQMEFNNQKSWLSSKVEIDNETEIFTGKNFPLGVAKAQLHENFIVTQSIDGLILVDQHAAHERITYEGLKSQFKTKRVESQTLLIPEIIELLDNEKEVILDSSETLSKLGFEVEAFGKDSICIRGVPSLLGLSDLKGLIVDIIDELVVSGQTASIDTRIDAIISRISCHGSIRSGRRLNAQEMNKLLRQMESTPFAAQCNHGRPTFVELKLSDIEKLFGRT